MPDPQEPTRPPGPDQPPAVPDDLLDESEPFDPSQWALHGLLSVLFEEAGQDRTRRVEQIIERATRDQPTVTAPAETAPGVPAGAPSTGAPSFAQRRVGDGGTVWPWRHQRLARPVYAAAGLLAAACIALLVIPWSQQPSFDAEVAAFADRAYRRPATARGQGIEAPTAKGPQAPAWIEAALDDPGVNDALTALGLTETAILVELRTGRLRLGPDDRILLADGVDEATARRFGLNELIEDDRAACETIVEALVRHVPGAKAKDRVRLAQALNRWRAEHVFGGG